MYTHTPPTFAQVGGFSQDLWPPDCLLFPGASGYCVSIKTSTRWYPPSYVCWFIIPINYRYTPHKP